MANPCSMPELRRSASVFFLVSFSLCCGRLARGAVNTSGLRFNEVQTTHVHNSFHQRPPQEIFDLFDNTLLASQIPEDVRAILPGSWEYSHPSITDLLEVYGVRSLEFDAYFDVEGGEYAERAGVKLSDVLRGQTQDAQDWVATDPEWLSPRAFKVFHTPHVDFETSCVELSSCLAQVAAWSDTNPRHLPLTLWIQLASNDLTDILGENLSFLNSLLASGAPPNSVTEPRSFEDSWIAELEMALNQSLGAARLLTPSELKLGNASLADAVLSSHGGQWPPVDELRGRVLAVLIGHSDSLLRMHPGLQGALLFPSTSRSGARSNDEAVFTSVLDSGFTPLLTGNDVVAANSLADTLAAEVEALVADGYIVRAQTDSNLLEARTGYTYRRDQMIAAGAQQLHTDVVDVASVPFETSYVGGLLGQQPDTDAPGGPSAPAPSSNGPSPSGAPTTAPTATAPPSVGNPSAGGGGPITANSAPTAAPELSQPPAAPTPAPSSAPACGAAHFGMLAAAMMAAVVAGA